MSRSFFRLGSWLWRLTAASSCVLLLWLTLSPSVHHTIHIPNIDKVFHTVAFFGVTLLFHFAFVNVKKRWSFGLFSFLGFLIEWIQYYIPGRDFSWYDWSFDILGILMALALVTWLIPQLDPVKAEAT